MQTSKCNWRRLSVALSVASAVGCAGAGDATASKGSWLSWKKSTASATAASAVPSDSVPKASSFASLWRKDKSKSGLPSANAELPVSKPIPPGAGPDLLVATAGIHEAAGRAGEAETYYHKALDLDAKHYKALLGTAHLLDRQNRFPEATTFYERAATAYPDDPAPLNDLGLCLARRRMYDKSVETLRQAVALAPTNKLYRNNLATVLLEIGDQPGALAELSAAHGEAIAHYNIGCLLHRKGKTQEAVAQFRAAVAVDPSMSQAHEWLAKLERPAGMPAPTAVATRQAALSGTRNPSLPVKTGAPATQPPRRWGQVSSVPAGPAPTPDAAPSYLLGNAAADPANSGADGLSQPGNPWGNNGSAPAAPTPEQLDRADGRGLSALPPVGTEYYPPSRY